jgi:hypothetical protein
MCEALLDGGPVRESPTDTADTWEADRGYTAGVDTRPL